MKTKILISIILLTTIVSCIKKDDPLNQDNNQSASTVTDKDGNVYHTVAIGTQTWMVENLKTTKYNDGTAIPNVTDYTQWSNLSTGAYCWYNNDSNNKSIYGALYNFYAVNTGKLAPKGWHVPSDDELTILSNYLGGSAVAGGKLKSTTGWINPNTGATNSSGFTALPAGWWNLNDSNINGFNAVGYEGVWWTSTKYTDSFGGLSWSLENKNVIFGRFSSIDSNNGSSVRCIKDN